MNIKGVLAAFFTALGWALTGVMIRFLPDLAGLFISVSRLLIALFFTILLLISNRKLGYYLKGLRKKEAWLLSFILFSCYILGTYVFQMAPVAEVSILSTTAPLFIILFKIILGDKLQKMELIGALMATVGMLLAFLPSLEGVASFSRYRLLGDFLSTVISILFAIYTLYYQKLLRKKKAPEAHTVNFGTLLLALPLAFFVFPYYFLFQGFSFQTETLPFLLSLGLFCTAVPTLGLAIASKYLPPLTTTSILLLEPILAPIIAFFLLQETPPVLLFPAIVLVLVGLYFILMPKKTPAV